MSIIQVIPFDMGCSIHPLVEEDKKVSINIIKSINKKIESSSWEEAEYSVKNCIASYSYSNNLSCYIMEFGIAVFVLKYEKEIDLERMKKQNIEFSLEMYRKKKKLQNEILKGECSEEHKETKNQIYCFMDIVWESIEFRDRKFSSTKDYKNNGLSYILSIYYIKTKENVKKLVTEDEYFKKNMSILMDPKILGNILDDNCYDRIQNEVKDLVLETFNYSNLTETSIVSCSWSGIAVIEQESMSSSELAEVINMEVKIQAAWLLYDCFVDNLNDKNYSVVELQKMKSTIEYVDMDMSNIISANMSTRDRGVIQNIIDSSGLSSIKDKANMIINNKISIENAYIQEKNKKYSIYTEVILLSLTIISAYDTIRALINSEFTSRDLIAGISLILIFIVLTILLIRKE